MPDSALIAGGSGGLGAAVVQAFLDAGWRVVVPWIEEGELGRLPEHDRLGLVRCDCFDARDVRAVVDAAAADPQAPLRAVVSLVGGFAGGQPVADTPVEDFEDQFRLNLRATYLVTQAAFPHLRDAGGGAIVCVSSRSALRPFAGAAGYCASKAAVTTFAAVVAEEGRPHGIRCNAILPSVIDTAANRATARPGAKMVPPEQIARVIRFLCSEDAAPTSGAAIPVYGDA